MELPSELLVKLIADYIPLNIICNLSTGCKYLYEVCNDKQVWKKKWKELNKKHDWNLYFLNGKKLIPNYKQYVQSWLAIEHGIYIMVTRLYWRFYTTWIVFAY
jgi:hypothetical protein